MRSPSELAIWRLGAVAAFCAMPAFVFAAQLSPSDTPRETRRALQAAIDAGGEVTLNGGVYELDAPLRITRGVTLRAADGAEVVLSGGRRLALDWRPADAGGFSAELPEDIDLAECAFDVLYVNGKRLHLARFPNYNSGERFFGGTSADALSPERVATWSDPAGAFVHALHRSEWGGDHWRIVGKNADGSLQLEGGWMNNRPSGMHPERRFVEGVREELDAPGEWFLDREARRLFVYPPEGVDLGEADVVASAIEQLLEVVGDSPENPAAGVRIEGVTLAHTARAFMKTREPLLRSDWMIHRGGAVYLENAAGVRIEDCTLRALGGNGVFVSGFAEDVTVRGCHLTDIGASGVCFVGKPIAVRNPLFNYNESLEAEELDREPGPKTEDYPRDCVVEDCLMHDLGVVEKQVAGVEIAMAARITVRHVSIYDTPRAGINIGDGTWGGHLIEWCDVFDTVQMTGDHGSFNSWGRDRFWHPNREVMDRRAAAEPELILLDAVETTVIRNSRWRCDHGWDIDLDDGSSNYELYNNLCLAGGIKLREGFQRTVSNNVMVNNTFHPHVWFRDSGDVFVRNIVSHWYRPIRVAEWGERVDYNLLPDDNALEKSHELGLDEHGAAGAPRYLDPASGDYRVADGSPALALGFKNFPMDKFGVQKPELRAVARSPQFPEPNGEAERNVARTAMFLGANVKRLRTLAERSATGMDSERGVLVLGVPEDSAAHKAGLRANDVILKVGGSAIATPRQLRNLYEKGAASGARELTIFRNQQEQTISAE